MHVFYVQGGGLGHLTRVDNLIKRLSIPIEEILIITPSLFTTYFKGYNFIHLSWKDKASLWTNTITSVIVKYKITSVYVDTFPLGLKGELKAVYKSFPNLNYVYIARLLQWEFYLEQVKESIPATFSKTIVLETLYAAHLDWIKKYSELITNLTLVPKPLQQLPLMERPYVLVVHSGGKEDVLKITHQAIKDFQSQPEITIVVFTQVEIKIKNPSVIIKRNTFPVSQYFEDARNIYTAAGFNSIYELKVYKNKHIIIPLEKLFDDQFFRAFNT